MGEPGRPGAWEASVCGSDRGGRPGADAGGMAQGEDQEDGQGAVSVLQSENAQWLIPADDEGGKQKDGKVEEEILGRKVEYYV